MTKEQCARSHKNNSRAGNFTCLLVLLLSAVFDLYIYKKHSIYRTVGEFGYRTIEETIKGNAIGRRCNTSITIERQRASRELGCSTHNIRILNITTMNSRVRSKNHERCVTNSPVF